MFHRFILGSVSVLLMVGLGTGANAQGTGGITTLSGHVTDAQGNAPLPGVTVRAMLESDTAHTHYTFTTARGEYRLRNLTPGKYRLSYSLLGYLADTTEANVVESETSTLDMALSEQPMKSQDVIVTASRHEEKELHSPASISVVTPESIRDHIAPTPTDAVENVPGMDMAHEGILYSTYATRGFHSVYGTDVLTMQDYHSLELPALAVFYGILMPETLDDIDHVEAIRGPGSALYGPDAAEGVVNFISKSPFASQGTNLAVSGGERNYIDADFREDEALSDKFAFTLSGHYQKATDWPLADDPQEDTARKYAQSTLSNSPGLTASEKDSLNRIGNRQTGVETYSFNARMDVNLSEDVNANISGGLASIVNAIAMTEDFGDAQIKNWMYDFVQARVSYKDLFIQAAINHDNTSSSSGSYFLPTGAPIIDHSSTYVLQLQHHWDPSSMEKLTYGADYKSIVPLSENTIYGPDDGHANTQIYGAYLQSQTTLLNEALEVVLAGRVDKDKSAGANLNPIFSPRAAAVYHFDEDNLVRAMYNNTYLFPTEVDLFSDLLFSTDAFGFKAIGLPTTSIRYVSPYVSGLDFITNPDGSYTVGSNLLGGVYNSNATLWQGLMNFAAHVSGNAALAKVPAPATSFTDLAYLNLNTKSFVPVASPINISPVQPQQQTTLEMDYQGAVSRNLQFEVDGYQTHYTAIRASTAALTPNVFADSTKIEQYMAQVFTAGGDPNAAADAAGLAHALNGIPLGVVQPTGSPTNESYPEDLLIGTRNYLVNTVQFYGVDLFGTYMANQQWSFDGSFSWVSKNYWYASELNPQDSLAQTPFALNMPKYRMSVGVKYSGLAQGLSVELRDRWYDAFSMYDNYWIGNVGARHVLDLTSNYRIESLNNLQLTLSITNLLNNMHQEFVGAPYMGRFTVLRASYALPPW